MKTRLALSLLVVLAMTAAANADLRAYWAFDEGSGDYAMDSSGYGNHGQLYAETEAGDPATPLSGTTPPSRIAGVNGDALLFGTPDGSNYNSVLVAKSMSLADLGDTWSMAMWIRQDARGVTPGGGSGYARVLSCPNYEVELGVDGWEYDYFWPYGTPEMQADIGTSYIGAGGSLGQWYHMAITYDGTDLKKYLNGQLVPNSVKNIPDQELNNVWYDDPNWAGPLFKLGCQTWPNKDFFVGALDDVAIWGDAYLDADAVAGLAGGSYTPLTAPVVAVPEPTSLALLVCGMLAFWAIRRP